MATIMAMLQPTILKESLRFRPHNLQIPSRSPSRSPIKEPQFAAQELDPLLGNLSPDAILRALRATETIPGGAAQDALTKSIADATPAEREMGIRAAFAAQKLREYLGEVAQWEWPQKRDRALGAGFVPPCEQETALSGSNKSEYRGCLRIALAEKYERRIEEIRDGLESLEIEEIKDHVLEAHVPVRSTPDAPKFDGRRVSYGRMRDFTALITATVIQALPELAKLNILLETWDVRLRVLHQLPALLDILETTKSGVEVALEMLRDPGQSSLITEESVEAMKAELGGKVSDLGGRIDRLLDMLEGQEDSLPQLWIDSLEKIEVDYAAWVVDAEQMIMKNKLARSCGMDGSESGAATVQESPTPSPDQMPEHLDDPPIERQAGSPTAPAFVSTIIMDMEEQEEHRADTAQRKPALKIDLPHTRHKRNISRISIAESTFSAFSDISNAEIVEAKSTQVLPSPKINLVDNPFRASRDDLGRFGYGSGQFQQGLMPGMLQRASTASIEVIPRDQLKRVVLKRSLSHDMLARVPYSPESTPAKALEQLTGAELGVQTPPADLGDFPTLLQPDIDPHVSTAQSSPLSMTEPLREPNKTDEVAPPLPRKSSRRGSVGTNRLISPVTPTISTVDQARKANEEAPQSGTRPGSHLENGYPPIKASLPAETLEQKIKDILTSLPANIRLAKDGDSPNSTRGSSERSTRASTPTPSLTLSPVKSGQPSRRNATGDSDIRVYHLTRSGQARDAPPVKLFVRAVGEDGQRVMVRVGGGWADLGEYLREYSAHHGRRSIAEGRLELASFPRSGQKETIGSSSGGAVPPAKGGNGVVHAHRKSRSPSALQSTFDPGFPPDSKNARARSLPRVRSPEPNLVNLRDGATPPPVPPIPPSYAIQTPTMATTATSADHATPGRANHQRPPTSSPKSIVRDGPETPSTTKSSTLVSPGATSLGPNYTPLGAAGPKLNGRRAVSYNIGPLPENEEWVQGMVGKARAVSGGPQIINGPTTTITTTAIVASSTPPSRRTPSLGPSPSPNPSLASNLTSSPSAAGSPLVPSRASDRRLSLSRPKSRMSIGDMSGIKRVFLRRKTEK